MIDPPTPMNCDPPEPTRSEMLTLARAIKHKWPIDPVTIENLPKRMASLTESRDGRVACRAAGILLEMNKQNSDSGEHYDGAGGCGVTVYIPSNNRD